MRYPKFLGKGDTIGLIAPSAGITTQPRLSRLNNAIKKFKHMGYNIIESNSVRTMENYRSASGEIRASELMEFMLDDNIDHIFAVAGGEFLMELVPYLDFDKLKSCKPKVFQGFSDNTGIVFIFATILDIATFYAPCFTEFGIDVWSKTIEDNYEFLKGNFLKQYSLPKYEKLSLKGLTGNELIGYNNTEPSEWKNLISEDNVTIEGRLLGGCIGVIYMYIGTKYDKVKEFNEKYKEDGIIWYLENCERSKADLLRILWQMREAGWFENAKGFIFGRSSAVDTTMDFTEFEAIKSVLGELNLPIIVDCDFGHISPVHTIVNGAMAKVEYSDGKGSIEQYMR